MRRFDISFFRALGESSVFNRSMNVAKGWPFCNRDCNLPRFSRQSRRLDTRKPRTPSRLSIPVMEALSKLSSRNEDTVTCMLVSARISNACGLDASPYLPGDIIAQVVSIFH